MFVSTKLQHFFAGAIM